MTPLKSEPLVRLLIADLVGEQATLESLAALKSELAELEARLDEAEQSAVELPHRQKYLLLVVHFLRGYLKLYEQLVDSL
jgi:hypothetical protein